MKIGTFALQTAALATLASVAFPASAEVLGSKLAAGYDDAAPSNIFTLDNACGCTPSWSSAAIDSSTFTGGKRLTSIDAALIAVNQNDPSYSVAPHFGGFDKTNGYQVNIYSSAAAAAANLTGDVFSTTLAPGAVSFGGPVGIPGWAEPVSPASTLANLPVDVTLGAGTYWFSVISLNDPDVVGQESIFVGLSAGGTAKLANPGGSWGAYFGDGTLFELGGSAGYAINGVAAVPEPSSWALFILGFGVVGTAARPGRALQAPASLWVPGFRLATRAGTEARPAAIREGRPARAPD